MLRTRTWLFWAGRKPLMHQGAPLPSPTALSPPPMVPTGGRAVVLGLQAILPGHKCRIGKGFQGSYSCPAPCSTLSPAAERKGGGPFNLFLRQGPSLLVLGNYFPLGDGKSPARGSWRQQMGRDLSGCLAAGTLHPPFRSPHCGDRGGPAVLLISRHLCAPGMKAEASSSSGRTVSWSDTSAGCQAAASHPPTAQSLGRVRPAMSPCRKDTCRCSANRPP